jgi:hypothetical protein
LRWKDVQAEMKKHGKKAKTKVVAKKKK